MKTKQPGGVLGRNLKHKAKIRKFAAAIVAIVVAMFCVAGYGAYESGNANYSKATFGVGGILAMGAMALHRSPDGADGGGGEGKKAEKTEEEKFIDTIKGEVTRILDGKINTTLTRMAAIEKALEGFSKLKEEDLKGIADIKTFKKDVEELDAIVKSIQEVGQINMNSAKGWEFKTVEQQLTEHIGKNKQKWEDFKSGKSQNFTMEIMMPNSGRKVATTMTVGANAHAYVPFPELIPGLTDLARNRPFLEQYVNSSSTNSARIVWMDKRTPEGNAQFIGEGEVKPLIDFNIVPTTSDAKKVADKIKVSTEMLEDIPFIAAEIENELKYQVDIAVDTALLSGDGIGDNLKGIDTYAGGYVLSTIETTNPTYSDAIRAAAGQIESLNFYPNYVFVNPIDAANMDLAKATDSGMYLLPPFVTANGREIVGVKVIKTNQIPVGSLLIGDMTKYHKRDYKPFRITYGWVNDDFEKNLVTVIGERRLHAYMSDNNTGAFIYDTFANIIAAIEAGA